jgi:flagellin-like hook-associated protein FlgL
MKKTISRTARNKTSRVRRKSSSKAKRKTRVRTAHGDLEIQNGLGTMKTSRAIAKTLKQAADASENLTTAPFHAAMAALDHLIQFLDRQRARLEAAKEELRTLYGEVMDEPNRRQSHPDQDKGDKRQRPKKRGGFKVAMSA